MLVLRFLFFALLPSLLFSDALPVDESTLSLAFGSFISGLLLTFTPCVLPMVPILSSIIVGQGEKTDTKKSFMLSLSYVLGTAFTYTIMGALAGATGEQLQAYFQNVWAIGTMSVIFALMAFSMFGLFTIQLPSFIQTRLNDSSSGIKGGSIPMVFLLGVISALILGACVSPVLISFLGVAIAKADAFLGAIMMFAMALGMGVPLLVLGIGAGKFLPKAGMWMDHIKHIFGVLLLGVSIYLFSTLSLVSPLFLWGMYLITLALFLGVFDKSKSAGEKLLQSMGIVTLVWGILLLVGAAYGTHDIYKPLAKTSITYLQPNQTQKAYKSTFTNITDMEMLNKQLTKAKTEKKMVIIYFYTDVCPVCKHLKETTWKDAAVKDILAKRYNALSVNMTDPSDEAINTIKKRFNIFGPPGFVFFDQEGDELKDDSFYGYQAPEVMLDTLELLAE